MAKVNWTIEKSAMSEFWDELPDLLLRYAELGARTGREDRIRKETWAREERLLKEKQQYDQDIMERKLKIQLGYDLLKESEDDQDEAQASLDRLETEFHKTTGGLGGLQDLYKTSNNSLEILDTSYEGDMSDIEDQIQFNNDKTRAIKNKIDLLEGALYEDIAKATAIMQGGAGMAGGTDPEAWDAADLGLEAFEEIHGDAKPWVESYFDRASGAINKQLEELQTTVLDKEYKEARINYMKGGGDKSLNNAVRQTKNFLGNKVNVSMANTGIGQIFKDEDLKNTMITNNQDVQEISTIIDNKKLAIASEYALMRYGIQYGDLSGMSPKAKQALMKFYETYKIGVFTAQGKTAATTGDFGDYFEQVEQSYKAWNTAIQAGDQNKADKINELHKKYNGTNLDIQEFYKNMEGMSKHIIEADLAPLISPEDNSGNNENPDEWKNLFGAEAYPDWWIEIAENLNMEPGEFELMSMEEREDMLAYKESEGTLESELKAKGYESKLEWLNDDKAWLQN